MAKEKITFSEDKSKGDLLKAYCSECENKRKHIVLTSIDKDGKGFIFGDEPYYWRDIYQVIQCQGCDNISFRNHHSNSEDHYEEEDGIENIYPETKSLIHKGKDFKNIPRKLESIYIETINCLNNNNHLLCAAGIRALIECLCKAKGILDSEKITKADGKTKERRKNLEEKIDELVINGFLTKENAESLHELRFMGNTALHELSSPKEGHLILAIEIMENTLVSLYEIPEKSAELKAKRLKK